MTRRSLEVLAARYVYEVLPLLAEYEMEGEINSSALASLRQTLGLVEGSTQRTHAVELAKHLMTPALEAAHTSQAAGAGRGDCRITRHNSARVDDDAESLRHP